MMTQLEMEEALYKVLIDFAKQKNVKRWNGRKTLNDFNLLDHAGRVTNICRTMYKLVELSGLYLEPKFKLDILEYAMYHDYGEVFINDIPTTIKQEHPELDSLIKSIESELMTPLFLESTKEIAYIVKLADIIDCKYEALSEIKLGAHDIAYEKVSKEDIGATIGRYLAKHSVNPNSLVLGKFTNAAMCLSTYIEAELGGRTFDPIIHKVGPYNGMLSNVREII